MTFQSNHPFFFFTSLTSFIKASFNISFKIIQLAFDATIKTLHQSVSLGKITWIEFMSLRMYFNLTFFPIHFDVAVRRFKELSYSKKSNAMYILCPSCLIELLCQSLSNKNMVMILNYLLISLKTLYRKTSLKSNKSYIYRASHVTVLILFSSWFPPLQSSTHACTYTLLHCSLYICASMKLSHFKIKEELWTQRRNVHSSRFLIHLAIHF